MVIEKYTPALYSSLGIFLPLIAVNCAILGASLFMQERNFPTVGHSLVYALGSGIGWLFAIVAFAAIRERLRYSQIPKPLQGLGISYIITGLMGLSFMAFLGM
jgi:Na+-transporting NADH:ubiquinone oxidoreductase subunit E